MSSTVEREGAAARGFRAHGMRSADAITHVEAFVDLFLERMGFPAEPQLYAADNATVALVACHGLKSGGPQLRCVETARELTLRGMGAVCLDGTKDAANTSLSDAALPLPPVPNGICAGAVRQILARRSLSTIVFLRKLPMLGPLVALVRLPGTAHISVYLPVPTPCTPNITQRRRSNVTVLLDTMDFLPTYHCAAREIRHIHAAIYDNAAARVRVLGHCPVLRAHLGFEIEHFHSAGTSARRRRHRHDALGRHRESVDREGGGGNGGNAYRILLAQEHKHPGRGEECQRIERALNSSFLASAGAPAGGRPLQFDCHAIHTRERAKFLGSATGLPEQVTPHQLHGSRGALTPPRNTVQQVVRGAMARHHGVGALFLAAFDRYDLLINWRSVRIWHPHRSRLRPLPTPCSPRGRSTGRCNGSPTNSQAACPQSRSDLRCTRKPSASTPGCSLRAISMSSGGWLGRSLITRRCAAA